MGHFVKSIVNTMGLFGVMAGAAVAIALFLSIFFLAIKRKEGLQYLWFGIILLSISLRLGKSIFYFILNDMAPLGLALGFLGLSSIGPCTLFMMQRKRTRSLGGYWHFIIPIVGTIACYIVSPSPWETILYELSTVILMIYLIFSWYFHMNAEEHVQKNWNRQVLLMTSGVWFAFAFQHQVDTMMAYAWGSIIASSFLYWIFLQSFQNGLMPRQLSATPPDDKVNQVKEALENQQLFKEPGMNLQTFATELHLPAYLVTRCVKQLYGRTFPETLNQFRVERVKQMLLDPKKEHLKIESLAYEVGFASPSAFYVAFKKYTGQTPKEYQKKAALLSA